MSFSLPFPKKKQYQQVLNKWLLLIFDLHLTATCHHRSLLSPLLSTQTRNFLDDGNILLRWEENLFSRGQIWLPKARRNSLIHFNPNDFTLLFSTRLSLCAKMALIRWPWHHTLSQYATLSHSRTIAPIQTNGLKNETGANGNFSLFSPSQTRWNCSAFQR